VSVAEMASFRRLSLLRRLRQPAVPSIRVASAEAWIPGLSGRRSLDRAVPGMASGPVPIVDGLPYPIHPCASLALRCKSVLAAWSLERYAWHTQTVNLYAPLTLPVKHTRGRHCSQVWSGGRLVGPRYTRHHVCRTRAFRSE